MSAAIVPSRAPVEVLDLRHFGSKDLHTLLEREAFTWDVLLDWDYQSSAEMILRYLDAKILPGYAAMQGGKLAGYTFFVYEGAKGVIGNLFADDRIVDDARATEERLLSHVIETLQQSPGVHRVEAQLLVHPSDDMLPIFESQGFRRYVRLFMNLPLPLRGYEVALDSEFEIRPWTEPDFQPAAHLITAAYADHIDAEINDQYRTASGALRFLNNIIRFPGCGNFDPQSSFVAVQRATQAPVGLILCSRVKERIGHITQICVLPRHRKLRLGEALVATAANNLIQRKFKALSLTVTQRNTRAVALYKRFGFDVNRAFDAFVWEG